MDHIDNLRLELEIAIARRAVTDRAALEAAKAERAAELRLLDAEDRPTTRLHRAWIRAWLAHDNTEADRIFALEYPPAPGNGIPTSALCAEHGTHEVPVCDAIEPAAGDAFTV